MSAQVELLPTPQDQCLVSLSFPRKLYTELHVPVGKRKGVTHSSYVHALTLLSNQGNIIPSLPYSWPMAPLIWQVPGRRFPSVFIRVWACSWHLL